MTDITTKKFQHSCRNRRITWHVVTMLREMERKGKGPAVMRFLRKAIYSNIELVQYLKACTVGGVA